ncbi:MAG: metallophosphoesterase [Anaerolineales bacterium]|nr:MAG: metallophosphoesterase [Anaerolineales bacterium]
MKRLAVLSDIHGNLRALEAVLADLEAQGAPDAYWVLGDLAAFCPWPAATIARLRELRNVSFVQGNTDRYVVSGRRPWVPIRSEADWSRVAERLALRDANFRWTVERLSFADYEFLRDLPDRLETDVPSCGRLVAVHANGVDDETFIDPDAGDDDVRSFFSGLDASLVLYGHTHLPVDRTVDGMRIVNPGSVGIPFDGDRRTAYAVLEFGDRECRIEQRRVEYDVEEVIAEIARVEHPAREWIARRLRSGAA